MKLDNTVSKSEVSSMVTEMIQSYVQNPKPSSKLAIETSKATGKSAYPKSYSAAVQENMGKITSKKTLQKKIITKKAELMFRQVPAEPASFEKICFRIPDARQLKKCESAEDARVIINQFLKLLEIKHLVFQWSKIGNSLIEIIVPTEEIAEVRYKINSHDMQILENPRLWEAPSHFVGKSNCQERFITRVAHQYCNARLTKIKECILRNIPGTIQALLQITIDEITSKRSEAQAANKPSPSNGDAMDVTSCQ